MIVDLGLLVGFLALSALLSAVPGPSVLLGTSRAILDGRRPAMLIVLGNALGGLVLLALVLAGLGAIVVASAELFLAVKIAGACYLLWLGLRALWSARRPALLVEADPRRSGLRGFAAVRQGFTVGVANPKSIVVLMAILPQFVAPELGNPTLQMAVIGLAGSVTQVLVETLWVLAASGLRAWFRRRPVRLQVLQAGGGVAMVGLAGRLAFERS